jgi:type IV pilus assembly protein PilY1
MPENYATPACESCDIDNWETDTILADLSNTSGQPGQPIQGSPAVGVDVNGEKWVFFGTGRFFTRDDSYNSDVQSFYGIKEDFLDDVDLSNRATKLLNVTGAEVFEGGETVTGLGASITNYSELEAAVGARKGWYFNFPDNKERNLGQAVLFGDIVTFTSYVPSEDPCRFEGETFLYAVDFMTGTAFFQSVIGMDPTITVGGAAEVLKRTSLGEGLSLTPNIHTGREEGSKAFVQTSIGAIRVIEQANPGITKSGKLSWEEEE